MGFEFIHLLLTSPEKVDAFSPQEVQGLSTAVGNVLSSGVSLVAFWKSRGYSRDNVLSLLADALKHTTNQSRDDFDT